MWVLENGELIEIPDEVNEEDLIECTWCNELFTDTEVRKEVNLGFLCHHCIGAIKSRGEKLTFEE